VASDEEEDMMETTTLFKVKTAAGAAWKVFFASWVPTLLAYVGYLAMSAGWLDGLISAGLYGPVTRTELTMTTFYFVGAMKLISMCFLLGALFLTWWARGLARSAQ
jgi:hypothetical protein